MPEIGNTAVFSQTDANNNTGTMPSWSGSAAPSTLDDAGRAFQGAVTREWNWRNVTLTTGGTSTAYTLTYSVAPAAYYNGQRFAFIVNAANTAAATLNVNALGAKNLRKMVNGTATALAAGDLAAGAYVEVAYNTVGDYFVILNRDLSMLVPDSNANGFLRNRIINGDMRIDQRNAGASGTTASSYTVDRWAYFGSQASKGTWQQNAGAVTPPTGHGFYLGFTSSSAYSVLTSDTFGFFQPIEGFNFADFGFGAAGALSVTLSFWVRSSLTGTHGGSLKNYAGTRSYPFTYTISSANTWEYKTVTIPGDTSGTWVGASNAGAAYLNFGLGVGSTLSGTAGAWAATDYRSATGAVSVVGTNAATWYITGVQLEAGSVATPFERRLYGQELALCQRYYQTRPFDWKFYGAAGVQYYTPVSIPPMRASPTVGGAFTSTNVTSPLLSAEASGRVFIQATVTALGTAEASVAAATLSAEL